jgi:hypothetical protein
MAGLPGFLHPVACVAMLQVSGLTECDKSFLQEGGVFPLQSQAS